MPLSDLRDRPGYVFLAVMLGHVILISAQVNSRAGVPVLEAVTFGAFAEVQRATSTVVSGVRRVWNGYIGLRHVKEENEALKRQLDEAQIALQAQRALADRSRGLERLLGLRDQSALTTIAADVIGASATPDFRTITLDKGTGDGLKPNLSVIAPAGVVGRVVVPTARAAKVQLLIDRNAAAGAVVERSRAQGLAIGGGEDLLEMTYVSETADIVAGDQVMTSGIDGIYPKGFAIGRVERVEKNGPSYKKIVVRPAVDFRALEEVLIVLTPMPGHDVGSVE
ncbi:MAG: rod shape-determining protein MreC [Acidobacteriota bacterium]